MKPLRITIVLPFPVTKPVGGAKIMYEYANRLYAAGHTVTVLHSIRRPYKKMKSPLWWKKFVFALRGVARPKWFPLNKNIKSTIVNSITNRYVPDADIVFSTWWQIAYAITELAPAKGKPVNLIQDFEIWAGQKEKILASFKLPIHHAVIAGYLKELLKENGASNITYFPNAIDSTIFFKSISIEERNPLSIIMLYSEESRKGSKYGVDALVQIKKQIPALKVTLFGVYKKPDSLPDWISYCRRPDNLTSLYNGHAIFLSPSLGEGWALPPAEAMACGCAVVCTNIGGHTDYAKDGETALLVKVEDENDIISKLTYLLENNNNRIQLANKGNQFLSANFNWDKSVDIATQFFYSIQ
ncbi:MAG TPA: glycosyltransferase family 4 protein [Chitinophagaceae bacterium]|nr:glycosyltransferase family 4 protein [Chitinophagaceae bacterium]MBP7108044.1 glycosyltransferase family 4 protein [Chitinophagaceae bacterium]MBP7313834.1 glycosyltransferase family 4 protein [Chitinophagaceae bacterium]HQV54064.1 glycosyltransferase family 4 protein [Chitinophagaceae bacterium]HQX96648.1 glycosyltransferase family 4 protein [Chitinophagaceae bacterium]